MYEDNIFRLCVQTPSGTICRPLDYIIRHSTWADKHVAESRAKQLDETHADPQGKYIVCQFRTPRKK